jgi:hypothetical protein
MKKIITVLLTILSTHFIPEVKAQTTATAMRVKRECKLDWERAKISNVLNGNGSKEHPVLASNLGKYEKYEFIIKKINGKARGTISIYVDGIKVHDVEFIGSTATAEQTYVLDNMTGRKAIIKVKNHSALDKFIYEIRTSTISNTLLGDIVSTIEKRFEGDGAYVSLDRSCNGKGSIELTRMNGTSGAEIVIQTTSGTVLKTETMTANQTSKTIIIDNLSRTEGHRLVIRNISTGQFIKLRIKAWHN